MRVRVLLVGSLLALAACVDTPVDPTSAARPDAAPAFSTDSVTPGAVVVFADTAAIPAEGIALLESLGGTISTRLDSIGVAFVTGLDATALELVAASELVALVGHDREVDWLPGVRVGDVVEAEGIAPSGHQDPTRAGRWAYQWNMRQIQADLAWGAGYFGAPGVKVAILDTGIDYTNREVSGLVDLSLSRSFVPATAGLVGDEPFMDDHFHGTHVASSVVTNNITVAGVAPHTSLVAVKVLSAVGSGLFEWVQAGIVYAADAGARVLNMSLGAEVDPVESAALIESMGRATRYAERKGAIVISAAGNDANDLDDPSVGVYLPCEVSTICVSATGPLMQQNFDQPSTYTNYGLSAITVAAPGGNFSRSEPYVSQDLILGACSTRTTRPNLAPCRASGINGYYYAYAAGTSMAAPHVAGVAAMLLAQSPKIPVHALKNKITEHADDINEPGRDAFSGSGRVNVYRSLTGN